MAGFDLTFDPVSWVDLDTGEQRVTPRPPPGKTQPPMAPSPAEYARAALSARDRARARLELKAEDLAQRVRTHRAAGYHCSADVLQDRLDLVVWQLAQISDAVPDGRFSGKVLVTPSIQSQFETPTPKSASV